MACLYLRFVAAIREIDARPILFMPHAYGRLAHTTIDDIYRAHKEVEIKLKVATAPGGLAHAIVQEQIDLVAEWTCRLLDKVRRPHITAARLFSPRRQARVADSLMPLDASQDGEHPSVDGLYLHAATIAAAVLQADPSQFEWAPNEMPPSKASFLKRCSLLP